MAKRQNASQPESQHFPSDWCDQWFPWPTPRRAHTRLDTLDRTDYAARHTTPPVDFLSDPFDPSSLQWRLRGLAYGFRRVAWALVRVGLAVRWGPWPWQPNDLAARARRAYRRYDSSGRVFGGNGGDNGPPPGPMLYCDAEQRIIDDWSLHRQEHPDHAAQTYGMRPEWFPPGILPNDRPINGAAVAHAAEAMGIRGDISGDRHSPTASGAIRR